MFLIRCDITNFSQLESNIIRHINDDNIIYLIYKKNCLAIGFFS